MEFVYKGQIEPSRRQVNEIVAVRDPINFDFAPEIFDFKFAHENFG